MASDLSQVIDLITRGAENFIRIYYDAIDNKRDGIKALFEPNASVVYNGNPLPGGEAVSQLYANMPVTHHDVGDFDCHPLAVGANGKPSVALTTSGRVRIGTDKTKGLCTFSESLVLRPQADGKYYVSSGCYRLVYKSEDVDIEP
ncbi:hypothetical protein V1511DRAFT_495660 [Dipodascopsis uninucleata]